MHGFDLAKYWSYNKRNCSCQTRLQKCSGIEGTVVACTCTIRSVIRISIPHIIENSMPKSKVQKRKTVQMHGFDLAKYWSYNKRNCSCQTRLQKCSGIEGTVVACTCTIQSVIRISIPHIIENSMPKSKMQKL